MTCLAEGVQVCILQYLIDNIININKNYKKKKKKNNNNNITGVGLRLCILQNILFRWEFLQQMLE